MSATATIPERTAAALQDVLGLIERDLAAAELEEAPSPAGTQPGGLGRRSHRSSIGPARAGSSSAGRRGPTDPGPRRSPIVTFPRPLSALSYNNRGASVPSVLQEET